MSTSIYRRLRELMPEHPLMIGTVDVPGKTATVELIGGGFVQAANPTEIEKGKKVFVQGGVIVNEAPNLPIEAEGEI